eukprot:TRINITY_DN3813_c0_g1_i2.p1 TRINITY_DN3813_c0_g1~~TRINITY_DN3813_c0_g1_i2.p1  ORF type:complete len:1362 (+),score=233.89 TRINITY_DN3813_c0_g1_i2:999-5084(+)
MQNVFCEKSTEVHGDMWPAVLLWVKLVPHGVRSIKNLHATFLQKLYSFLRKGSGVAASAVTYQSVYPLLALVGIETLRAGDESLYYDSVSELLISIWNGVRSNTFPIGEFQNLVNCWCECYTFILNNTQDNDTVKQLVGVHLKHMIDESIFGGIRTNSETTDLIVKALVASLNHSNVAAAAVVSIVTDVVNNIDNGKYDLQPPPAKKKAKQYEIGSEDWTATEHSVLRRFGFFLSSLKSRREAVSASACTEITVLTATVLLTRISEPANMTKQIESDLLTCWNSCLWDHVQPLLSKGYSNILNKQLLSAITNPRSDTITLQSLVKLCNVYWNSNPQAFTELLAIKEAANATNASTIMDNVDVSGIISADVAAFSLRLVEELIANPTLERESAVLLCCRRLLDDDINKLIKTFCLDKQPSEVCLSFVTTMLELCVERGEVSGGLGSAADLLQASIKSVTTVRERYLNKERVTKFFDNWSRLASLQPNVTDLVASAIQSGEQGIRDCLPVRIPASLYSMNCVKTPPSNDLLVSLWEQVSLKGFTPIDDVSSDVKFYANCEQSHQTWSNALEVFISLRREGRANLSIELLQACFRSLTVSAGSASHARNSRRSFKCILQHCASVDFVTNLPCDTLLKEVSTITNWDSETLTVDEVVIVHMVRALVQSVSAQKLFVQAALKLQNNSVLLLIMETIKQSTSLLEKCDLTDYAPVIVDHAQVVAEKDEIGEDIPDGEVLSAILLLQWVAQYTVDNTAINEAMPGLTSAAFEKLQDEPPTDPLSLQHKLELAACLIIDTTEVTKLNEIASYVAAIVQAYTPAHEFSWVPSGSEKVSIPISTGVRRSIPGVKKLVTDEELSIGSRAMILTFSLEVLLDSFHENRTHLDESVTILSDFICGLPNSVVTMLSPNWNDVFYELYNSISSTTLSQYRDPTEIDSDFHINTFFDQYRSLKRHTILSVVSRLAVFTESNFGVTTETDEGTELPPFLTQLLDRTNKSGQHLLPDPGRESHQNYKSLSKAKEQFLRPETLQDLHEYLVSWHLIVKILDRAMEEDFSSIRVALISSIKELDGMLQRIMGVIGGLLLVPRDEVSSLVTTGESEQRFYDRDIDIREAYVSLMMGFSGSDIFDSWSTYLSTFNCQAAAALGSTAILRLLLSCLPSAPRRWVTVCDPSLKSAVNNFVQGHLSQELIRREFDFVIEKGGGKLTFERCDELKVRVQPGASCVVLEYDHQDTIVAIKIVVPPSFPLTQIHHPPMEAQLARQKAGLREDVWRKWLLKMTAKLNKSARLWDCIVLWQQNLTRHFDGQEPCPICYTVVNTSTQQLPSMECSCCHGKYHKLCLFKWFKKSNNSTCPLCRAAWYSNPVSS